MSKLFVFTQEKCLSWNSQITRYIRILFGREINDYSYNSAGGREFEVLHVCGRAICSVANLLIL